MKQNQLSCLMTEHACLFFISLNSSNLDRWTYNNCPWMSVTESEPFFNCFAAMRQQYLSWMCQMMTSLFPWRRLDWSCFDFADVFIGCCRAQNEKAVSHETLTFSPNVNALINTLFSVFWKFICQISTNDGCVLLVTQPPNKPSLEGEHLAPGGLYSEKNDYKSFVKM